MTAAAAVGRGIYITGIFNVFTEVRQELDGPDASGVLDPGMHPMSHSQNRKVWFGTRTTMRIVDEWGDPSTQAKISSFYEPL